jgi:uncharacterized protein (DUF1778 family)
MANEPKVKRMNINIEASMHDAFKAATAAQGKNMTDVLLDFIADFVKKHGISPPRRGHRG